MLAIKGRHSCGVTPRFGYEYLSCTSYGGHKEYLAVVLVLQWKENKNK